MGYGKDAPAPLIVNGLSAKTIPAPASSNKATSNPAICFMRFLRREYLKCDLGFPRGSVSYPCYRVVTTDSASVDRGRTDPGLRGDLSATSAPAARRVVNNRGMAVRSLPATFPPHQRSFRPNCTWREVVEVLVIAPAVPDKPVGFVAVGGVKTIKFGVLKLARSSRLKISARNCKLSRSRILVSFSTEKSQVTRSGPT